MDIKDLAVPVLDWNDFMSGPWRWKRGMPEVGAEVVIKYHGDYEQNFGVVAKNPERGELYGFYGDKRDITSFITVRLDYVAEISERKSA